MGLFFNISYELNERPHKSLLYSLLIRFMLYVLVPK